MILSRYNYPSVNISGTRLSVSHTMSVTHPILSPPMLFCAVHS